MLIDLDPPIESPRQDQYQQVTRAYRRTFPEPPRSQRQKMFSLKIKRGLKPTPKLVSTSSRGRRAVQKHALLKASVRVECLLFQSTVPTENVLFFD